MSFERFVALRYLKAKRKQKFISLISFISLAGVALGVMALIVVIGVMTGFDDDLKKKILSVNAHIVLTKPGAPITDYRRLAADIAAVPGVAAVQPSIATQVMIAGPGNISGGNFRGLPLEDLAPGKSFNLEVRQGTLAVLNQPSPSGLPQVAIGTELARNIGVPLGSQLRIISPLGTLTPMGRLPRVKRFQVGAIFHTGMYEYDSSLAYGSLPTVQAYLGLGDAVTGLEIRVQDLYAAGRIAAQLQAQLGEQYQVRDWMRLNKSLFAALKLERLAMFVILTLIVLVAAFNIASTLIMLVMEKTRDIAILQSMGATRQSIRRIFMLEGIIIGTVGTAVGLTLGLTLTLLLQRYQFLRLPQDVYYLATLPVQVHALDVAAIAGAAILISFLATLYPAWQASRVDPVEAIRYG